MKRPTGIDAPETVPEGSQQPIRIYAPGRSEVTVTVIGTGDSFTVNLDGDGHGQFELPTNAVAGEVLTIVDFNNPEVAAVVEVIPATGV